MADYTCRRCAGAGGWEYSVYTGDDPEGWGWETCGTCYGHGWRDDAARLEEHWKRLEKPRPVVEYPPDRHPVADAESCGEWDPVMLREVCDKSCRETRTPEEWQARARERAEVRYRRLLEDIPF